MPYFDDTHPDPMDWLKANASRFVFADQQIIDSAISSFGNSSDDLYSAFIGIYFLIANNRIIYVGQSNCVEFRLDQHRQRGMPFDSFTWFEAPEMFLNEIEAYYIRRRRPPLNRKIPHEPFCWELFMRVCGQRPAKY